MRFTLSVFYILSFETNRSIAQLYQNKGSEKDNYKNGNKRTRWADLHRQSKKTSMCVFLDILDVFDDTSHASVKSLSEKKEVWFWGCLR